MKTKDDRVFDWILILKEMVFIVHCYVQSFKIFFQQILLEVSSITDFLRPVSIVYYKPYCMFFLHLLRRCFLLKSIYVIEMDFLMLNQPCTSGLNPTWSSWIILFTHCWPQFVNKLSEFLHFCPCIRSACHFLSCCIHFLVCIKLILAI